MSSSPKANLVGVVVAGFELPGQECDEVRVLATRNRASIAWAVSWGVSVSKGRAASVSTNPWT
jgi:hypothetical protein